MTVDFEKQQNEKRRANYAKLHARMWKTYDVIVDALRAAGLQVKPRKHEREDRARAFFIDVVDGPSVHLEALIKAGSSSYYSVGPTGQEPLVLKVGGYPTKRIQSAKEDPDLTGVRVPLIVKAVVDHIAHEKRCREQSRTREMNERASEKIAMRCNKLADGAMRFRGNEKRADCVTFTLADLRVTEDEAKEIAAALMPILAKIEARQDGEDYGDE